MAIKLEEMLNEFRYPSAITTDKAISTSSNLTVGGTLGVTGAVTLSGGITATGATINGSATVTGNATITGNETVGGTLTVTGAATIVGATTVGVTGTAPALTVGTGGPQVIAGSLVPPANPTGITATVGSLFINIIGTGVTNRMYINTNGATGWTYFTSGA